MAPALLQHPSASVRAAAVDFVAAAAHFLAPADVYAHLLPLVMPAVTAEPAALTSQAAIVEQLPQQLQQAALDRAGLGSSASPSNALGSRQVPGSHTASDVSVSSASSLRRAGASPLAGTPLPQVFLTSWVVGLHVLTPLHWSKAACHVPRCVFTGACLTALHRLCLGLKPLK